MENCSFFFTISIFLLFLFLVSYFILSAYTRRKRNECKTRLPPGSMGWPFIGETLRLYSQDPNLFFSTRHKRYGEIFKSHILGCPCVMLAGPDAARFVLLTQAHLFKPTFPKSKEALMGRSALFFHQGHYHLRLRKLIRAAFYPDSLRKLVASTEATTLRALSSWAHGGIVNTYDELKRLSFDVGVLAVFGDLDDDRKEELKKNYCVVNRGYNSFPTIIPGSPYRKALKARKKLSEIVVEISRERKEKKVEEKDLLSCLLSSKDDNGGILSEEQIADNIIGVLFAAQDTTASAMTWLLKYLHDHPKLLEAVKAEQKAIYESNGARKRHLTWNQTRKMPFTNKVILESLRMSSIISFTFREAVADVEYKGCLIPKGWKVMPLFRNIHHNPELFADPQNFDPSRFEGAPKPNTFMPFGSGVHSCPGNELAKLEMLILVHHLTSQFRYEVVGCESGVEYGPFPIPLQGLPARFWREEQ